MPEWLQNVAMKMADWFTAVIPQAVPDQGALRSCRIIAHRGEHDNISLLENTLPAFELARANGVWGIECDIRWSADLVPMIHHDHNGSRLFGHPERLCTLSFAEVREKMPQIPTLAEVVSNFGGDVHLMLEIKAEHYPQPERQKHILKQHLASLSPGKDYHFLALDPRLFAKVNFVPPEFCFPVAELNVAGVSKLAIDSGYGGISGHYLLLSNRVQRRHAAVGQRVGTGYISSRGCLFRELNRGIEWIFSNHAVRIQKILDSHLSS